MFVQIRNPGLWATSPWRWALALVPVIILHVLPLCLSLAIPHGLNGDSDNSLNIAFFEVTGATDPDSTSFLDPGDGEGHSTPRPLARATGGNARASGKLRDIPIPAGTPEFSRPETNETSLPDLTFNERIEKSVPDSAARPKAPVDATDDAVLQGSDMASIEDGGEFTEGYVMSHRKGNALDRAMGVNQPRVQTLRIPGKPIYPKACREGLCRQGRPCEGTSSWEVWVAAEGGRPTKVECVKRMPCELQNASTQMYFQTHEFPKTDQPMTYLFNVTMRMTPDPLISSSAVSPKE